MPARLSIFRGRVQTVMQFSQLSGGGGKPGTVTPSPEGRYSVCVCVCVLGRGWGGWGGRKIRCLWPLTPPREVGAETTLSLPLTSHVVEVGFLRFPRAQG